MPNSFLPIRFYKNPCEKKNLLLTLTLSLPCALRAAESLEQQFQNPPDCEWLPGHHFANQGGYLKRFPDWFVKKEPRPSKGRFCFTTWNYFTKDSPLIPSGLLGPVMISTTK